MRNNREFRTASLYLAAWLLATKKLTYFRSEPRPQKPGQKIFVFDDSGQSALSIASEFLNGDPVCGVKAFTDAIKTLRDDLSSDEVRDAAR